MKRFGASFSGMTLASGLTPMILLLFGQVRKATLFFVSKGAYPLILPQSYLSHIVRYCTSKGVTVGWRPCSKLSAGGCLNARFTYVVV